MISKRIIKKVKAAGFTIIELLTAVVVIGILSAVAFVAFHGINDKVMNANRVSEFQGWVKLFQLYKAQFGTYPNVPKGTTTDPVTYCLGTGFPLGGDGQARCRDYTWTCDHNINPACTSFLVSDAAPLMTELAKAGKISATNKIAVNGTVGPYVEFYEYHYAIQGWFSGSSASDCPGGTKFGWTDGDGRVSCYQDVLYTD